MDDGRDHGGFSWAVADGGLAAGNGDVLGAVDSLWHLGGLWDWCYLRGSRSISTVCWRGSRRLNLAIGDLRGSSVSLRLGLKCWDSSDGTGHKGSDNN